MHLAVARCREGLATERAAVGSDVKVRAQVALEIAEQPLGFATDVALVEDVVPLAVTNVNEDGGVVLTHVVG